MDCWKPVPDLHEGARQLADDPLVIETPSARWAYAASFRLPPLDRPIPLEVVVDVELARGEVGLGLLNPDGSEFLVERWARSIDGRSTVRLRLTPNQLSHELVLRNVGPSGEPAVAIVHGVELRSDIDPEEWPSKPRVELYAGGRQLADDPIVIETPSAQWAYAASFPLPPREGPAAVEVVVDVEVTRGEVGLGLLNLDGSRFHTERCTGSIDGRSVVSLKLDANQPARVLVLRNVGPSGEPAVAIVHGLQLRHDFEGTETLSKPRVEVASKIFDRFRVFSGDVPAGFWVNWLGVKTRAHVWPFPPEVAALYARHRHEAKEYPLRDEHVLDWLPLLDAVAAADTTFRMVALGAGWGRWLTAGAFAARQLGKLFDLTGVEAEPNHFAWMEQHMRDNDLPPHSYRLLRGAASPGTEDCWFPVAKPDWYGQSIVEGVRARDVEADGDELVVNGTRLQRVPAAPIERVVTGDHIVDYLHMDIQGTEFEFLSRDPDRLQRFVRVVNIGTHSELIERRLRLLFGRLGWRCRHDIAGNAEVEVVLDGGPAIVVKFGDGAQIWWNPALQGAW